MKALTWPGKIVHIVHTDDPRDTYVEGDIIIRGESLRDLPVSRRAGQYNLYNNRLLDAIPGDGWVHFMDDDDEYAAPDVFERLLQNADPEKVIAGHVQRGRGIIPAHWGTQESFQTEIPVMRVDIARDSRWPSCKGGDHIYNKPICRKYGIQWVEDVLIATSREGKGNGHRNDMQGADPVTTELPDDAPVWVKPWMRDAWVPKEVTLAEALRLEKEDGAIITFRGVEAEYRTVDPPEDAVEFDTDIRIITGVKRSVGELVADAVALGLGKPEQLRKHSRVWLERAIRRGRPDGFRQFMRVGVVEMRPYIEGENLAGVETRGREPKAGDMIERTP